MITCTRCGKALDPKKMIKSLELDQRINKYHDFGVPEEHSQGWFDFGPECVSKARAEARKALGMLPACKRYKPAHLHTDLCACGHPLGSHS